MTEMLEEICKPDTELRADMRFARRAITSLAAFIVLVWLGVVAAVAWNFTHEYSPSDAQVNRERLCEAIRVAFAQSGVTFECPPFVG